MKRFFSLTIIITILSLIMFGSGCNESQGTASGTDNIVKPGSNQSYAKITFENPILDFGTISPGVPTSGQYNFKNIGNAVLEISKISECCGISTSLEKKQYQPGESGVIKVNFSGAAELGDFSRNPIVQSNDPVSPSYKLTVKAQVEQVVVWQPERIRLFLEEENAGCPKLSIKSLDQRPFALTEFKSTGDCISAEIDPSVEASEFTIDLKVDIEKLKENPRGVAEFTLTHPNGSLASILYDVLPEFSISPTLINSFESEPNKPIKKLITIKSNSQDKKVVVESISSKQNTIKVLNQATIDTEKVTSYQIDIEIIPPEAPDNILAYTDILTINLEGGHSLAVTCNIYYKKDRTQQE